MIVRQIRRNGVDFELTVDSLLELRRAGASDEVIGAILDAGDDSGTEDRAAAGNHFRVYETSDRHGRPVVVITNLDERGRRMGGEAAVHRPANIVLSPDLPSRWQDHRGNSGANRGLLDEAEAGNTVPGSTSPVTIVINNAQPQTAAPIAGGVYPCGLGCNTIGYGGLIGGFKYPDKLYFLGYDPRNSPTIPNTFNPGNIRIAQPSPRSGH